LGVGLALTGTLFGRDQEPPSHVVAMIFAEGSLAIVLLRIGLCLDDRIILRRFSLTKEIQDDRNLGAAFAAVGSTLAAALVLNGALTGFSTDFWSGLLDIVLYFALGQTVMIAAAELFHRVSRFDVHELIEHDNNVAVGLELCAFLVGVGLIVRTAIVGSGTMPLADEILFTSTTSLCGVAFPLLLTRLVTVAIAPRISHTAEVDLGGNIAISIITSCLYIAATLAFSAAFMRGW
jgi:uncharacterized membrane protein YjfL (UPF0719 family)